MPKDNGEKQMKDPKTGRFVKGNPGGGRPKGSFSLVEMIKNKLQEKAKDKDKTYAEYFIDQLIKKTVVDGDVTMMRDMINRIDGMPKQGVDVTSNGQTIVVSVAGSIAKKNGITPLTRPSSK